MIRLLCVLAFVFASIPAFPADWRKDLRPAKPWAVRDGCANSERKLRAGGLFTVAFLGGSITANAGSFAHSVPRWLEETYPGVQTRVVNAGWGGTTSELGAQRLEVEVLAAKPDLVFVEFAVNDMSQPEVRHMERIVRKIWTMDPEVDVVFLYALAQGDLPFYERGWFPLAPSRHEIVAEHYGVPMIAPAQTLAARIHAEELKWEDVSADTCHPHAAGYQLYQRAIADALPRIFAGGKAGLHRLPDALTPGLVLTLPAIPPEPLPEPPPMQADDGRMAARVFEFPQLGIQWTGSSDFAAGDRTLWRLYSQRAPRDEDLDNTVGLSRVPWKTNVTWLDEPGFFLDQSFRWIAGGRGEQAGRIGASAKESAVVSFIAPSAGEYLLEFSVANVGGYSRKEKMVGLNVVHFEEGMAHGTSVQFWQGRPDAVENDVRRTLVEMAEGDEVAFVFLPHEVGGGAFLRGFSARFGLLR